MVRLYTECVSKLRIWQTFRASFLSGEAAPILYRSDGAFSKKIEVKRAAKTKF